MLNIILVVLQIDVGGTDCISIFRDVGPLGLVGLFSQWPSMVGQQQQQ